MKAAERQSVFKARNSVVNVKANNVCLGVFPYQIEFTSNQEFTSVFYFEKDLQIIGTITTQISRNHHQTSLPLRNIDNLITFRIYKFHSLNYKWSQYRVHETGQEEFMQSAIIDLKAQLGELVPMSSNVSSRSHESYIIPSNVEKQLRVKLQKTGVIINFLLLISDEQKQLETAVKNRFFRGLQSNKPNKVEQPKENQMLRKQTQKQIKAIDLGQGGRQQIVQQITNQNDGPKEGYLLELDALILHDPDNNHLINHDNNQTVDDKAEHPNAVQNEEDDLCFGVQKPKASRKISNDESKAITNPQKEKKKTIVRDYSLLRLESDQGRAKLDPIDRRLESEQFQVIHEQEDLNTSFRAEETANQESSKQTNNLALKTEWISSKLESYVNFSRQNKTKISIILLIVLVTLLAAFPRQLKLRKKNNTKKDLRK